MAGRPTTIDSIVGANNIDNSEDQLKIGNIGL